MYAILSIIKNLKFCAMSTGKILFGVLAGVAAGAVLGILFAPAKGSKTRKKIAKKGMDYADELSEKLKSFMEEMTEKFESAVNKANGPTGEESVNSNSGS